MWCTWCTQRTCYLPTCLSVRILRLYVAFAGGLSRDSRHTILYEEWVRDRVENERESQGDTNASVSRLVGQDNEIHAVLLMHESRTFFHIYITTHGRERWMRGDQHRKSCTSGGYTSGWRTWKREKEREKGNKGRRVLDRLGLSTCSCPSQGLPSKQRRIAESCGVETQKDLCIAKYNAFSYCSKWSSNSTCYFSVNKFYG